MAKTIQGKPENEIQKELMTILKTEDYSIMDVTNKPYFKAETLTSKVRNLLGFNWETDPNILNSDGDMYRIKEEFGQIIVSVKVTSIIKYDDGSICNKTSAFGIYQLEKLRTGDGYQSIVDAVKSAQTVAKKMALMEFINTPEKPKKEAVKTSNSGDSLKKATVQITQAGVYLRNKMIKVPCIHNGQPKVITFYSETVQKMSKKTGISPEAIAVTFKPGTTVEITYSSEKTYGNEQQLIANYTDGLIPTEKDTKSAFYNGSVIVSSAAILLANGTIKVPCTCGKDSLVVILNKDEVNKLSKGGDPAKFSEWFSTMIGKKWPVAGLCRKVGEENQLLYGRKE